MSAGEVYNMDEVSNGCSIWSTPIGTEDLQDWSSPCKHCSDYRDQIARFLSRIFAEDSRFMTSNLSGMSVPACVTTRR
jgi:hypothetical protein